MQCEALLVYNIDNIYKYILIFICMCECVKAPCVHILACICYSNINSLVSTLWPLCMYAQSLLGSYRGNWARQTSMLCVCLPANPHTSHPSYRVRYQANEMNTHLQSMGFHLKAQGINARPFCTPPTLWGWGEGEKGGKKWQGGSPMGCYSNDRFIVKVLHARKKHKNTFHHQRNVSKCFIPQICSLLFLK